MSATLIPTKTAGERPPIIPPVTTTFDGTPSDDGESVLVRMTDDVRWIVRHADAAEPEGLPSMIEALAQRKGWVESELDATRMMMSFPLPSVEGFSIDYLVTNVDRFERALIALIEQLDACTARCERRLARHRLQMRLLRDLGASDS